MLFAEIDIDWGALGEVAYISAIAGILIASVLGFGITAQLRQDAEGGNAMVANVITGVAVLIVAAAVVLGIYFITDK